MPAESTWLVSRLDEDYPGLRRFGKDTASCPVSERRIIPVLDGLDELIEPHPAKALRALYESVTADDPLIITCRTAEYTKAVEEGDVLTAAAVIHAHPVVPEDAESYRDHLARTRL
jgi:hypothetical protein